ncbi:gp468 [Bacillus phage G]|uniref:Gp468 n=1 Tax=Bacillus phage G TaxID=2884420 RepID=G3MAK9_9CAUD|nr:gp468 [Bacillus phage G]AEO93726.1 gp468 [Bacillus phage G]
MFIEAGSRIKATMQKIIDISDDMEISVETGEIYKIRVTKGKAVIDFKALVNKDNELKDIRYKFPFNRLKNLETIIEDLYLQDDKELSNKLEKIYCSNNICPICNSKLERTRVRANCENGCYSLSPHDYLKFHFTLWVFDNKYDVCPDLSLETKTITINEICSQIDYWKENDNYLAEIIKGEN